jgi:hypothetical protein
MPRGRPASPPELRQKLIKLEHAGRSPEGLGQLRKESRKLRVEREILAKATAWFAREPDTNPRKSFGCPRASSRRWSASCSIV